ncbi:hypothetical protein EDB83DRAFT_1258458 [Lactarius deliciosus]|nr:hypothetical protein EDB83DRAFT_1258458 [Lactarius deliciosus]
MFSCPSSLRIEPRRGEMVSFLGAARSGRCYRRPSPPPPKGRSEPRSAVLLLRTHATTSCPIRPYLFTSGIKGSYGNRQLRRVRCNDAMVAVVILCSVNGIFFFREMRTSAAERGGLGPPSARYLYRRWLSTDLPITPAVRSQSAGGAYPTCVRPGGVCQGVSRPSAR